MCTYQGGKQRLGKKIYQIITQIENDIHPETKMGPKTDYFEPMVGMAGVLKHFAKDADRKICACDINPDIITLWKALQKGWKPPLKCTEAKYERLKASNTSTPEKAFIGIVASWGGNYFHAYRLKYEPAGKSYLQEGYNKLTKLTPIIKNVHFIPSRSYDKHSPKNMIVYCDPPYTSNKLSNKTFFGNFNHADFWDRIRRWSKHNIVVVSEWSAPSDFRKICNLTTSLTSNAKTNQKIKEHLYVHKDTYAKFSNRLIKQLRESD